ncbi:hypothetical protein AWB81_08617 [Caballeronia arationis]|nr:hypothetical protein AWB81_08493 [Caballeronia arationis]SAL08123.1 hypothetical protein AWB81_08617 [Caballeronia arationis]
MRQNQIEILILAQRAMGIEATLGHLAKAAIEVGDEVGRIGIGRFLGIDAAQSQLLHQPILQGQIGPLNASFCLAAIGTPGIDIELVQGPPVLGNALAGRTRMTVA